MWRRVKWRLNTDRSESIGEGSEFEHRRWDPKDGELFLSRMKPGETRVEVRRDADVQIARLDLGIGAKDSSNHLVAGSLRSFPQDSWCQPTEFRSVKQMIRGIGELPSSTYSQTLNGREARVA